MEASREFDVVDVERTESKDATENNLEGDQTKSVCYRGLLKYRGMFYAFLAGFIASFAQITVKKATNLSGSEYSIIRNGFMFFVLLVVIKYKKLEFWGPKKSRKILALRGFTGTLSLLAWSFAIMTISPADVIALLYVCIVITAILSRIFLKEKLGFAHIISVFLTIAGVFLIAQPDFIFGSFTVQDFSSSSSELLNTSNSTSTSLFIEPTTKQIPSSLVSLGIFLSLFSAFTSGLQPIMIKHLANQSVHYSVVTVYVTVIGLPLSIIVELILVFTGTHTQGVVLFQTDLLQFFIEVLFAILTAVLALFNQILFNMALEYEDPTKCTVLRSFEVFLTFLWQRLLLGVESNLISILGAACIFFGALGVVVFKLFDSKYAPVISTDPDQAGKPPSKFRKCFFYKF